MTIRPLTIDVAFLLAAHEDWTLDTIKAMQKTAAKSGTREPYSLLFGCDASKNKYAQLLVEAKAQGLPAFVSNCWFYHPNSIVIRCRVV